MTVREKLEIEMDKEEVKRWEEENVESEESDKNNIPDNNDSADSVRSDQRKRVLDCRWKFGISSVACNIALVAILF